MTPWDGSPLQTIGHIYTDAQVKHDLCVVVAYLIQIGVVKPETMVNVDNTDLAEISPADAYTLIIDLLKISNSLAGTNYDILSLAAERVAYSVADLRRFRVHQTN